MNNCLCKSTPYFTNFKRRELSRALTLLELTKRREKTKREYLHLSIEVFEKRYQVKDFSGHLLSEYTTSAAKTARYVHEILNECVCMWFACFYRVLHYLGRLLHRFSSINTHMLRRLRPVALANRRHHNGPAIIISFRRPSIIPPQVQRYRAPR